MRCASVIFSFELSSEGIRTFAKGPEGGEGVLAMRLTIAFVNLVSNTVPNLKPAARASLGG